MVSTTKSGQQTNNRSKPKIKRFESQYTTVYQRFWRGDRNWHIIPNISSTVFAKIKYLIYCLSRLLIKDFTATDQNFWPAVSAPPAASQDCPTQKLSSHPWKENHKNGLVRALILWSVLNWTNLHFIPTSNHQYSHNSSPYCIVSEFLLNGVSWRVMKAEECDPADLAEDGRQRGRCCLSITITIAIVVISYLCPQSCPPVSLLLHDCRDRLCRLQRLFLLPRSLPLRRRPHSHDPLLQAMLSIVNY